MSEEHKALGYRPPANSLAAHVQAAVARHECAHSSADTSTVDEEKLRQAAKADAERIKLERETLNQGGVDLDFIGEGKPFKVVQNERTGLSSSCNSGSRSTQAYVG